jgi:hypothetical protein
MIILKSGAGLLLAMIGVRHCANKQWKNPFDENMKQCMENLSSLP